MTAFTNPASQALMLVDEVRMNAYARAIAQVVGPDDVVLDVGTGSGILALIAARAGARRVIAVEQTGMADLARAHARDNQLADRVEVIQGRLEDLPADAMGEPVTVVISETLGMFAPDEQIGRLFRSAQRFTAPEARTIPTGYRVAFALGSLESLAQERKTMDDCQGLRLASLRERLKTCPRALRVEPKELLSGSALGSTVELGGLRPDVFEAQVTADKSGEANAIVASFEADLALGITLATHCDAPATHWKQMVFPLDPPLSCAAGETVSVHVRPLIVSQHTSYRWSARCGEQARGADAMQSLVVSNVDDLLNQLGLQLEREPRYQTTRKLHAFAAVLAGPLDGGSIEPLAERLMTALPGEFATLDDARDEVMVLLKHARAI